MSTAQAQASTAPPTATPAAPSAPRPRLRRELTLGLAVFAVYSIVDAVRLPGRAAAARSHALDLLHVERLLQVDVEASLNTWLAPHHTLRVLANYEYAVTYVLSAGALLAYLWFRRPDVYPWARRSFLLLNLIAVACFAAYPVTPPRLLAGAGYVDTVRTGHTWGSWGSPLVGQANQLAAMPSLHLGWALWVSVVLAAIAGGRRTQLISAVHVALTTWVVLATANHYLLDAVAALVLVVVCVAVTGRRPGHGDRVAPSDAFFLHVETPVAPQQVGGSVLLDVSGLPGGRLDREQVAQVVRVALPQLPRFRQLLVPAGWWRRARWVGVAADELDLDWHVAVIEVGEPSPDDPEGRASLDAVVSRLEQEALPLDRPPWRVMVVPRLAPGRGAVVLLAHHAVADGLGVVAQARHLLSPGYDQSTVSAPQFSRRQVWAATAVGLAQLATDGPARGRLPSSDTSHRGFVSAVVPLDAVREVAHRQGARVTDVVLSAVAGGLARVLAEQGHEVPQTVRCSVPRMLRDPTTQDEGNFTGTAMTDLPLVAADEQHRLAEVVRAARPLRSPTRALGARFAMEAAGTVLPPGLHRLFARTVYGRRYFSLLVSNMPGPDQQLTLTGAPLCQAWPVLPLAPGAPVAVGTLGWNGQLCLGMSIDPTLAPAQLFGAAVRQVLDELMVGQSTATASR